MKKQFRTIFALLLICCFTFSSAAYALIDRSESEDRKKHDADIEMVLFGERNYKSTHPVIKEKIQALQDATYLALDQFNNGGAKALDFLRERGIPDLPSTIGEFKFKGNYSHRLFTHRGWNLGNEKDAKWSIRVKILRNTVHNELFQALDTPLSWFPWAEGVVFGKKDTKQQESFCILLYYIHVLGDHLQAEKFTDLAYISPLVRPNNKDNPGLIPEVLLCMKDLFSSQINSYAYISLKQELENIQDRSEVLINSSGGINTEEKFTGYHQCADDVLNVLSQYIPQLLDNETFFHDAFKQ